MITKGFIMFLVAINYLRYLVQNTYAQYIQLVDDTLFVSVG